MENSQNKIIVSDEEEVNTLIEKKDVAKELVNTIVDAFNAAMVKEQNEKDKAFESELGKTFDEIKKELGDPFKGLKDYSSQDTETKAALFNAMRGWFEGEGKQNEENYTAFKNELGKTFEKINKALGNAIKEIESGSNEDKILQEGFDAMRECFKEKDKKEVQNEQYEAFKNELGEAFKEINSGSKEGTKLQEGFDAMRRFFKGKDKIDAKDLNELAADVTWGESFKAMMLMIIKICTLGVASVIAPDATTSTRANKKSYQSMTDMIEKEKGKALENNSLNQV